MYMYVRVDNQEGGGINTPGLRLFLVEAGEFPPVNSPGNFLPVNSLVDFPR